MPSMRRSKRFQPDILNRFQKPDQSSAQSNGEILNFCVSAERSIPARSIPRRSPTVDKRCMLGGFRNTRSP